MSRVRTFLALALEASVRERIAELQDTLKRVVSDVNWVREENLHLTLLFLGEVDDRELLGVCRAAQRAVADLPAFTLSVAGASCFPNIRRPRVLWVGLAEGQTEVVTIHDALEAELLELGCYRREERQYTPHITLGHVKSAPPPALGPALARHLAWQGGETRVDEVLIMGSRLTPHGSEYTVLGRAPLA